MVIEKVLDCDVERLQVHRGVRTEDSGQPRRELGAGGMQWRDQMQQRLLRQAPDESGDGDGTECGSVVRIKQRGSVAGSARSG